MKKIIFILISIFIITGCNNSKSKEVVCKMDDSTNQAGVNVTYTYTQENEVTHIETASYFAFTKEELKEVSLDDYYKQIKTLYSVANKEDGVQLEIKKDEKKNRITMKIDLDTEYYDLDEDILNVSAEGDVNDVSTFIEMKEALGVYECGKIE